MGYNKRPGVIEEMNPKQLVLRNVCEVVVESELDDILKKDKATVYCGYETSGPVHIGHMVTVTKLLDLMKAGFEIKVLFADVHTRLNRKGSESWIDDMIEYWTHSFKAMGLNNADYVKGSDFQFEKDYINDVLKLSLSSTMNRALRSMQEVARDIENARVSQVIYPLMQIADIKALDVDIAYGGLEQRKIHMLAREMLGEIDYKKPVCIHTPLLCSLGGPDTKMSSSMPETIISIDEDEKSVMKKISSAYCPMQEGTNPILDIVKLLIFPRESEFIVERSEKYGGNKTYNDYQSLESDYLSKNLHPADLKKAVGTHLNKTLDPIRDYFKGKNIELPKN